MGERTVARTVFALLLGLLARQAAAVEVDQIWMGSLPAHRALCRNGSARGAEEFSKVPASFVGHLTGVASIGNMYFESVVADQVAGSIAWRLCAPVGVGEAAPEGFELVDLPVQPAVFGLCTAAESAAECSEATLQRLGQLVDAAHLGAVKALRPRGMKVAAMDLPLDAAARVALAQVMVDPRAVTLTSAWQPDSATIASLLDDTQRRRAGAVAPAAAPLAPTVAPRNTSFVAAALTVDLADVLGPVVPFLVPVHE